MGLGVWGGLGSWGSESASIIINTELSTISTTTNNLDVTTNDDSVDISLDVSSIISTSNNVTVSIVSGGQVIDKVTVKYKCS